MSSRHVASSLISNSSHTTNNATKSVPLSKRLLFPTAPASSFDLPPLLLNPLIPPELNAELYDFIALALRAFVQPWWTKITRYDKEFLPIITEILTHAVRTLEERLANAHQKGDLAKLVFRDVPLVVTQHYRDFRIAQCKVNSSYAAGGALSFSALFHASQSHIAVKPDGEIDSDYVRFLVDHILKTCLPKQDWDPEPERVIVREIVVKIVVKDIFGKITQPWFIEKMILEQLMSIPSHVKPKDTLSHSNGLSLHTLIVFVLTLIQSISGACLALVYAYRQLVITIKEVNHHAGTTETHSTQVPVTNLPPPPPPLPDIDSVPVSRTPSEYSAPSVKHSVSSSSSNFLEPTPHSPSSDLTQPDLPPDYASYPLLVISEIFNMDARFASNAVMSTVGMATSQGVAGGWIDKLLPYLLTPYALSQRIPCSPPIDPTPEEQAETRQKLINFLDGNTLASLLLGPYPSDTISAALEPLENRECNFHLIMILLDSILGVLFPELFNGTG
ncbi:PXA domain-containing protein [Rhodocollybia butyracea]|uniref:PXA domain-containing protein n=1 Tax=Rhodocollybia butyracea TaxID=206335 RepID=A0A9P5UEF7_9AGAR|nr:PXA domain-containing protein [Rhodocollybia butyracea]